MSIPVQTILCRYQSPGYAVRHGEHSATARYLPAFRHGPAGAVPVHRCHGNQGAVYDQAINEAALYMPLLRRARYRGYTVGTRSAWCDPATGAYSSRALVFRDFDGMSNYHVVLGGKVSCMFDVLADVRHIVG